MPSGQLSISGKALLSDCSEVVTLMKRLGINGDVTPNQTVLDGSIEQGCRILVASKDPKENVKKLWTNLQDQFGLTCAHVDLLSHESGCVFDVYRKSSCPG
jgi:hypothetical protein